MLERLKTFALVTLIAMTIWLFAEGESLGEASLLTFIEFAAPERAGLSVEASSDFDGTVTIELRGSRAGIAAVRDAIADKVRLEPGAPGVPAVDGEHSVNLFEALQAYRPLVASGVSIAAVRPQTVRIKVRELATVELAVSAELSGVEVVGAVKVSPERATLRLPRAVRDAMPPDLQIAAKLSEEQRRQLPPSGPARLDAALELPPALAQVDGVQLLARVATIEFTVRNRSTALALPAVPVQVVLPSLEVGRWSVALREEDQFLPAELSGPDDAVSALRAGGDAVIALLSLSSDELESGVSAKDVSFVLLREGAIRPLPPGLSAQGPRSSVKFEVRRIVP